MIRWFKRIINNLFFRNKVKMLKAPKVFNAIQDDRNDFIVSLKKQADIEQDDGNGYRIIKNLRLEDMV